MIKYRRENFGYILYHSPGNVKIFSHEIEPFLEGPPGQFSRYEIDSFNIAREQFHLSAPVYAFIELTQKCNLRCKHCYNSSGEARDNELDSREVLDLLDELARLNVFCIFFTGGEPLLRKDLPQILSHAASLGFETAVITNGTLIDKKILAQIPENTVLGISLDGIESHARIRDGVSFDDMVKKIRLVKESNLFFTLLTTTNKDNIDELGSIFKWSAENEVVFSVMDCLPVGRARHHLEMLLEEPDIVKIAKLVVVEREAEEVLKKAYRKKHFAGSSIDDFFNFVYRMEYATRMCKGGRSVAYITSDGDVFPCSNCSATGLFRAGNIRQNNFEHIWNHSFGDIRDIKWQDFKECKNCEVAKAELFCEFRCPALSQNLHDDLFVCGATDFIRKSILVRTLLSELLDRGIDHSELSKHLEYATSENLVNILMQLAVPGTTAN